MFGIRRNEDVGADVYAGARALLEGDNRQTVEEVIQDLLTLGSRLLGDAVADLGRGREDTAVVPDLRQAAQAANRRGCRERLQISVVHLSGKASRSYRIEAHVFVDLNRESVWADGPMEGHKHLALLGVADALHRTYQSGALGH